MKKLLGIVTGIGGIGAGSGLPSLVDTTQKRTLQMNKEDFDGMASGGGRKWCWIKMEDGKGGDWEKERNNIFWNVSGGKGLRKMRFAWPKGGKSCQDTYKNGGWMWRLQWGWRNGENIWGSKEKRTGYYREGDVIVGFKWDDGTAVLGKKEGLKGERGLGSFGGGRSSSAFSHRNYDWCFLSQWGKNLDGFKKGENAPQWNAEKEGRKQPNKDCWKRGVALFDWMWVKGRA